MRRIWMGAVAAAALTAGCDGGQEPIATYDVVGHRWTLVGYRESRDGDPQRFQAVFEWPEDMSDSEVRQGAAMMCERLAAVPPHELDGKGFQAERALIEIRDERRFLVFFSRRRLSIPYRIEEGSCFRLRR